MLFIKVYKHI